MKKQTNAEQIVLNRMFVVEYLEHNLGHEVINVYGFGQSAWCDPNNRCTKNY